MMLTCKEATRLVSQGLDRKLSFGERLMLPAWLESRRRLVEARLPHLELPTR